MSIYARLSMQDYSFHSPHILRTMRFFFIAMDWRSSKEVSQDWLLQLFIWRGDTSTHYKHWFIPRIERGWYREAQYLKNRLSEYLLPNNILERPHQHACMGHANASIAHTHSVQLTSQQLLFTKVSWTNINDQAWSEKRREITFMELFKESA